MISKHSPLFSGSVRNLTVVQCIFMFTQFLIVRGNKFIFVLLLEFPHFHHIKKVVDSYLYFLNVLVPFVSKKGKENSF